MVSLRQKPLSISVPRDLTTIHARNCASSDTGAIGDRAHPFHRELVPIYPIRWEPKQFRPRSIPSAECGKENFFALEPESVNPKLIGKWIRL